jgi:transcriptional regulator of acetoin/glycerol metabolism
MTVVPAVAVDAARQSFLVTGSDAGLDAHVRPQILASWRRSRGHAAGRGRPEAGLDGLAGSSLPAACAQDAFGDFLARNPDADCSLTFADAAGVIRVRCDGGEALGPLLDGLGFLPGCSVAERDVGTTAAGVALHERADVSVSGAEHYQHQFSGLCEAAAVVTDPLDGAVTGAVMVICHVSGGTALQLPLARTLAGEVARRAGQEPRRAARAVLAGFLNHEQDGWVLATDGEYVLTNAKARQLDGQDVRELGDLALASLVLGESGPRHVHLPSGGYAAGGAVEIIAEPVTLDGQVVGCLLSGHPASAAPAAAVPEAVRRQGAHVAPTARRDYAAGLRVPARDRAEHAEARIRANRELLTPFLRAREEVTASIKQQRNHLLIGEPGVGKRTLLREQYRQAAPHGRLVTIDCASYAAGPAETRHDPFGRLLADDGRPGLIVLQAMNLLTPVTARRLDEALRPLVALGRPPLVAGCIDTPAVDATRPYGLLLRHFREVTRIPALRYRIDEIGDIALATLHRLSPRRSLRLSHQVIRVLEGYPWPGNISELEDVLRYVTARKPVGEIQPPDLPVLCFQGRARRMTMLETAQCDAIIQALYESKGNRYKAALMLGIARSSLYRKIDAFGISYIA